MEQNAKKPRATWKRADEKLLLKCYLAAHNDASLKSDKGVKSKGWAQIVARLAKEGISADKEQSKTKYSRLMYEYDVFRRLCGLSGAGWDHKIQAPTLTDDGWTSLMTSQPRNTALYKRFREEGFDHSEVCALIAGDSRANAADATSVTDFLASKTSALLNGPAVFRAKNLRKVGSLVSVLWDPASGTRSQVWDAAMKNGTWGLTLWGQLAKCICK